MQVIVYTNDDGGVSVIWPTGEVPLDDVLKNDLPAGKTGVIIDSDTLPDPAKRSEWALSGNSMRLDVEQGRAKARSKASLDRAAFCKRVRDLRILSAADAEIAAKGDWPSSFDPFIASLSATEQSDARIDWAVRDWIDYSNPLLAKVALFVGKSPANATALLDQIFAIG